MGCTPSLHSSPNNNRVVRHISNSSAQHAGLYPKLEFSTANHSAPQGSTPSVAAMKGINSEAQVGMMRIRQHSMSILLVFCKEDAQSSTLTAAAHKAGFSSDLVHTYEKALEKYRQNRHDVVIIDCRSSKTLDSQFICQSIRSSKANEQTVIVAITKKPVGDKDEASILPLFQAGFNKRLHECTNISVCHNELLMFEHEECFWRPKVQTTAAAVAALDYIRDSVHITDEDHNIQYVNRAFEKTTGYNAEETLGKNTWHLTSAERNRSDLVDSINVKLKVFKPWDGLYYIKKKSGDVISHHCKVLPIQDKTRIVHLWSGTEHAHSTDKTNNDIAQINGGFQTYSRRRESIAKIHAMSVEAPINKVIALISMAQRDCPITVFDALDKALDILRTPELYSPYISQVREEDAITSELVGGLMTTGIRRRSSIDAVQLKHVHGTMNSLTFSTLTEISPAIKTLLAVDCEWEFNILELERLSEKRPLVYLGLSIFQRFGVLEFLQVSETLMVEWLQMIEVNYHVSNPYHNSTHAADVLHATAFFLDRSKIKDIFDNMDEVASLIAAVVHDLDHPGRTNSFLINAGTDLALLYNDLAVLESHHASCAFQLTRRKDSANIFCNLGRDDYRALRQQIIDMVLATEMTKHFEHVSKFVSAFIKNSVEQENLSSGPPTTNSSILVSPENRMLIKRMLIKCADVSNPTRPLQLCAEWAKRISEEYCQQTDEEKNVVYLWSCLYLREASAICLNPKHLSLTSSSMICLVPGMNFATFLS